MACREASANMQGLICPIPILQDQAIYLQLFAIREV